VTLVNRPELMSQRYQERIAQFGVKTVILQALPGLTLNAGWNYNSNKFLVNRQWIDRSVDVAWNLLNLASLPISYQTAKMQVKYEQLKAMALTMTALTETRYAFAHYQAIHNEYIVAHKQTENATAIYNLNKNRELASLASAQQVILTRLRVITATMEEDLLLSDLSTALGELYLSVGIDILPASVINEPLPIATESLKREFAMRNTINFNYYINATYTKLFTPPVPVIATHQITKTKTTTKTITRTTTQTITASKTPVTPITTPTPPLHYTLQLFGSYDLASVKELQNKLHVPLTTGKTKFNNRDWYILTYGKYTSVHEAKSNMVVLPKQLNKLAPWIRKTDEVTWIS
jgi:septal ring-binding cell division protein DamX